LKCEVILLSLFRYSQ